jgi:hypothetical protein
MIEVIRRLKMTPEIGLIGTSFSKRNHVAEILYRDLGFNQGEKIDDREII